MLTAKDMLDTKNTIVKDIRSHADGSYTAKVSRHGVEYNITFTHGGEFICNPA